MTFRKIGLFAVMLGAMALSFNGQVETLELAMGRGMAIVFALTMDVAALLGLHELMTASSGDARLWAWLVLVVAGGTSLLLNTWHTVRTGELPTAFAVVIGVVPVILAGVLSHLLALSMAAEREASRAESPGAAGQGGKGSPASRRSRTGSSGPPPSGDGAPEVGGHQGRTRNDGPDKPEARTSEPGEVTEDLLVRAAEVDTKAARSRAGYRTLKEELGISEPLARKVRTALDERQAGGRVIPMHRSGEPATDEAGKQEAPGWRSEDQGSGRHPDQVEEVAK